MPEADLSYAFNLPPRDAVAWFESKHLRISRRWTDVWQEAHSRAFTVAGMTRLDLLRDVRAALSTVLREGKGEDWFRDTLAPTLRSRGWTGRRTAIRPDTGEVVVTGRDLPTRLSLIYFQNVQTAYMAGRYRGMLANVDARPYWQYIAVLDSRTRPHHRALHGRVFRWDDVFWKTHYPPNGWRCRCRVRALSAEDMEGEGLTVSSGAEGMVSRDVELRMIGPDGEPVTVTRQVWGYRDPESRDLIHWTDVGFSYHPGAAAFGVDAVLAQKMDLVKSDALYAEVVQAMNNAPARQAAFAGRVRQLLREQRKTGAAVVVGFVQPEVVAAAVAAGLEPARIAVMTDEKILHAGRRVHEEKGTAPTTQQYLTLARHFADPEAVYWDATHRNALYVFPDADPEWCLIMPLTMPTNDKKTAKRHGRLDGVATLYRQPRSYLARGRLLERLL